MARPRETWHSPPSDVEAYRLNRRHRWVYNRLVIAEDQDLLAGPHGIEPPAFPVFSKPVMNLDGMGAGIRICRRSLVHQPGYMWMALLEGAHLSIDMMLEGGDVLHVVATLAHPGPLIGTYDGWEIGVEAPAALSYAQAWAESRLADYSGSLNVELIGPPWAIFEAHLRLSWQYTDLYHAGGYSSCLFVKGQAPEIEVPDLEAIERRHGVRITLDRDEARPPGATRLATINGRDRTHCEAARAEIAIHTEAVPLS